MQKVKIRDEGNGSLPVCDHIWRWAKELEPFFLKFLCT
jgi:hypothetical protein